MQARERQREQTDWSELIYPLAKALTTGDSIRYHISDDPEYADEVSEIKEGDMARLALTQSSIGLRLGSYNYGHLDDVSLGTRL